jgi:hypothetical protein
LWRRNSNQLSAISGLRAEVSDQVSAINGVRLDFNAEIALVRVVGEVRG